MEINAEKKKGPGRPVDPNAIKYRSIGLRPKDWEYFKQWQSENDEETNFSRALENLIAFAREFAPGGPAIEKPRDERGWFLPAGGTSRNAQTRERRRLAREAALAQEESDVS